jgi:hypothetical protein
VPAYLTPNNVTKGKRGNTCRGPAAQCELSSGLRKSNGATNVVTTALKGDHRGEPAKSLICLHGRHALSPACSDPEFERLSPVRDRSREVSCCGVSRQQTKNEYVGLLKAPRNLTTASYHLSKSKTDAPLDSSSDRLGEFAAPICGITMSDTSFGITYGRKTRGQDWTVH